MYFLYLVSIVVIVVAMYTIVMNEKKELYVNGNSIEKPEEGGMCKNSLIKLSDIEVYVINLDRNRDRLEHFLDQYMSSDLKIKKFNRFKAIEGKSLKIEEYVTEKALKEIRDAEDNGYRTKHYQLTRGAIGCYLSHRSLYNTIKDQDKPYAIIFEDDVDIDSRIFFKTNEALKHVPEDWEMLLLGCFCVKCNKHLVYLDVERFFLLHGYIIRKETAKKLHEHLENKKIEQQIDWEISDMIKALDLKVYCLKDSIARQKGFKTNIQMPLKIIPGINPYSTV